MMVLEALGTDEQKARWFRNRLPSRRPGLPEELVGVVLLLAFLGPPMGTRRRVLPLRLLRRAINFSQNIKIAELDTETISLLLLLLLWGIGETRPSLLDVPTTTTASKGLRGVALRLRLARPRTCGTCTRA